MGPLVRLSLSKNAALSSVQTLTPSSEAWRYTGPFTRANRFKNLFPGFGIASVAFGVYLVVEHFFFPEHDHHEAGHHTHVS